MKESVQEAIQAAKAERPALDASDFVGGWNAHHLATLRVLGEMSHSAVRIEDTQVLCIVRARIESEL